MFLSPLPARQIPIAAALGAVTLGLLLALRHCDRPGFTHAVQNGSLDRVRRALDRNPALVTRRSPDHGLTPLHWAAMAGQAEMAALLLDRGAAVDAPDETGMTPLHKAAAFGRLAAARVLVARGASLDARAVKYGGVHLTPLHLAAEAGQAEMAASLIEAGADVNVRSTGANRVTPLHMAAARGHVAAVRVLLKAGAEVNARDVQDCTPLSWARTAGQHAVEDLLSLKGGTD